MTSKKSFLSRQSKPIRVARQGGRAAVLPSLSGTRAPASRRGQKQASLCRLPDEPLRCTASRRHTRQRTRPSPARICRLKRKGSNQSCTTRELVGNNGTENALPVVIAFGLEQTATAPSVHGLAGGCQVAQRHFLCLQHQADLLNFPFPPLRELEHAILLPCLSGPDSVSVPPHGTRLAPVWPLRLHISRIIPPHTPPSTLSAILCSRPRPRRPSDSFSSSPTTPPRYRTTWVRHSPSPSSTR